jgi:MFS family permease
MPAIRMLPAETTLRRRPFDHLALYFCGQGFSNCGTWVQQAGLAWLVLELSRAADPANPEAAAYDLGLIAFVGQAPSLLLSQPAGVWADRFDRRRVIQITQAAAALQALALAILVLGHMATTAVLVLLSLLLGSINAAAAPAMQSIVADLVGDRRELSRAIAVSSSLSAGARLLGPAIGAGLVWAVGPGVCFLINALSYFPLLFLLPHLPARAVRPIERPGGWFAHWREAFVDAMRRPALRAVLVAVAGACLFGMSFYVLLPLAAAQILHGDEGTYTLLVTAVGVGGAAAVSVLVLRSRPRELAGWMAASQFGLILALAAIAPSRSLVALLVWPALAGFAVVMQLGAGNILLHTLVDDDKRGRIAGLFTLAFTGLTPIGAWGAGALAGSYGVPTAVWSGAAGMLVTTLISAGPLTRLRRSL